MTVTRRRMIAIAAAGLGLAALPRRGETTVWRGRALGAEAQITLAVPQDRAAPALAAALAEIQAAEAEFSLYRADSTLGRLNARGALAPPSAAFADLLALCDRVHRATDGRFDPTIQPLWQALATGGDVDRARTAVGWARLTRSPQLVRLAPGQALTLNGIAQGWATDRVAQALRRHGLGEVLVDIGEIAGAGGPWTIGIADPAQGIVARTRLRNGALASSSPAALALPGGGHILDPKGASEPIWSTVTVEADRAVTADALSTALCLCSKTEAERIAGRLPGVRSVRLIAPSGRIHRL